MKSRIIAGLKKGVSPEQLRGAAESGQVEELLEFRDSHAGDFMFVREGTVHSLGADNIALEIQENSDSTYRLHDWGRTDSEGRARALHIGEAVDSVNFDSPAVEPLSENDEPVRTLCDYKNFKILAPAPESRRKRPARAREEPRTYRSPPER